ncbi:MAG: hypothetical protein RL026_1996 [Pseudomonadota bacterium]|jgi:DNA polymerase-3 subunit epsilon
MNDEPDPELEAAARLLEASPHYRVLRRFVPRDDFGVAEVRELREAVVVDTETTGTDFERDRIIELAMVRFAYDASDGRIVHVSDVYGSLEDPGVPIPPETTAIHGITDDMVAGHQIDDEAVAAMLEDVEWVVAHNAAFDRPLLERRLPLFAARRWACSVADIAWKREGFSGAKLEYLALEHGFFFDGHRSEIDCRAVLEVLRTPLPRGGVIPWRKVIDSAARTTYRVWALNAPIESKDLLKARGYRWDGGRRIWHREMDRDAAAAEAPWLREQVYGGRNVEVEIEVVDALCRYSRRPGRRVLRRLRPDEASGA